jgi:hypothetical protein
MAAQKLGCFQLQQRMLANVLMPFRPAPSALGCAVHGLLLTSGSTVPPYALA